MKDLTYGWKRMTGQGFALLPKAVQKKATVILFTKTDFPELDGIPRKVLRVGIQGVTYIHMPEDKEDPELYLEDYYTVFMKVPVKVGRFIP